MHFAFVDDTKQNGLRDRLGSLLALGAVIFPEDQLRPYSAAMRELRVEKGIPPEVEVKWAMPHGQANYFRQRAEPGLQDEVRRRMLHLAAAHRARACVVIFDLGRTSVQGETAEKQVLKYLYERINGALEGDRGVVVFDKPGGDQQDEDAWISRTLDLTSYGTEHVEPESIVLPILTAPSHHHEHLQLADLVAGSMTAAVAGNSYGMALVSDLMPIMHTNRHGYVGGTGLKLFPNSLWNLYFHVLGEDAFVRTSWNGGHGLPIPELPYATWDGLPATP